MNGRASLVVLALTLGVATFAHAQAPTRVRGAVTAIAGDVITIKAVDGKNVDVRLGDKTAFVYRQPIPLTDIKQGDFVAVTSLKRSDGALAAVEVRRFPKPVNPGHGPFEGRDDQTMTNATVDATVQAASGRELMLSYDGGSQKIVVPANASISTLVPGQRSQLMAGAAVSLTATVDADGKLVAQSVQFSKPDAK